MPNTTNGLPYPVRVGVQPDVQNDIKLLAEALDPMVPALADTGWNSLLGGGGTLGAGWGYTGAPPAWRAIGKQVFLAGEVFNGSTGSANVIFTLPALVLPPRRLALPINKWHGSSGAAATLLVATNGECSIVPVTGSAPTASPGYVLNACTWLRD